MKTLYIYQIDSDDRFQYINDSFIDFAADNGRPELNSGTLYGKQIWDYVTGKDVLFLQKLIVNRVRQSGEEYSYNFRCDSPAMKRDMRMRISASESGGICFTSELLDVKPYHEHYLYAPKKIDRKNTIHMCSYCKGVKNMSGKWLEIELALEQVDDFSGLNDPYISHGICDTCKDAILNDIKAFSQ